MLLLYIWWDDWPIFMISASKEQLQQQLEYTLLKPDSYSWWISKMQSATLEERYAIKFCFKLGKSATETYGMLQTAFRPSCRNWASVFEWHKRFKEGRESVRDDERCERSKEVNTQELIVQRVRVTMLRLATEKDINTRLTMTWTAINKLLVIWKSDLTDFNILTLCYILTLAPAQKCYSKVIHRKEVTHSNGQLSKEIAWAD